MCCRHGSQEGHQIRTVMSIYPELQSGRVVSEDGEEGYVGWPQLARDGSPVSWAGHRHPPPSPSPFTLSRCPLLRDLLTTLWYRHKKEHNKKYFKCEECDYQTLREDALENHKKRFHSKKKKDKGPVPHKCEWCDFTRTKKSTVIRHQKTCPGKLREPGN